MQISSPICSCASNVAARKQHAECNDKRTLNAQDAFHKKTGKMAPSLKTGKSQENQFYRRKSSVSIFGAESSKSGSPSALILKAELDFIG